MCQCNGFNFRFIKNIGLDNEQRSTGGHDRYVIRTSDGYSQFLAQSSIIRTVIINMWERVRSEVQTPGCSLCTLLQNKETETLQLFVRHF